MTHRVRSLPLDAFAAAAAAETVVFRATPSGAPDPDHRALTRACVEEASERLGAGTKVPRFSLGVTRRQRVPGRGDLPEIGREI